MSEPFIAEVRIWANNYPPRGWAQCNGQLLPIAQNTALFSLLGTIYGGDGRTTFGLPNLQGRAAMHPGRGPGLTTRRIGQVGGEETVTLSEAQMGAHRHTAQATTDNAQTNEPTNDMLARPMGRGPNLYLDSTNTGSFIELQQTGGGGAHNNMQPYLVLQFCIALVGLYPSRS